MPRDILKYFSHSHSDFLHAHGLKSTAVLIDHLDCQPKECILEIGFGTGATMVELAHRFPETHFFGLEQSAIMLEKAQQRLNFCKVADKIALHLSQNESSPFAENQFDKVFLESVLAIQNEDSLKSLLGKIQKWLKPGGILICNETIWLPTVPISLIREINAKCLDRFGIIQASEDFPYTKDWIQLLESFGFIILQSNAVSNEKPTGSLVQNQRSRRFTRKGKIRSNRSLNMRKEWKAYEQAMEEIIPPRIQLMEGWMFKVRNEKASAIK